jgi:hypothetical protein
MRGGRWSIARETVSITHHPRVGKGETPRTCGRTRSLVVHPIASLDRQSRLAVSEFALHFSVGCSVVIAPCVMGLRPWQGAVSLLAILFSFNSVFNACRATLRKEKLAGPCLNCWDEAMAFSGCAFLLRAIAQLQS